MNNKSEEFWFVEGRMEEATEKGTQDSYEYI